MSGLPALRRLPLAGRVRYAGYVSDEERERLYSGARLLVLPSLDEGFGLPALEAMSAGVPVVASNRGSLPEVVGSAGVLVDPDDVAALSAALERFAFDDAAAAEAGAAGWRVHGRSRGSAARATLHRAYARRPSRARRANESKKCEWPLTRGSFEENQPASADISPGCLTHGRRLPRRGRMILFSARPGPLNAPARWCANRRSPGRDRKGRDGVGTTDAAGACARDQSGRPFRAWLHGPAVLSGAAGGGHPRRVICCAA